MIGRFSGLYITVRPTKRKGLTTLKEHNELKHVKILRGGFHLNGQTLVFDPDFKTTSWCLINSAHGRTAK